MVTNTGNVRLTGLEVSDDHAGVSVSCPDDSLAPGPRRPAPRPPTPSSANTPTSARSPAPTRSGPRSPMTIPPTTGACCPGSTSRSRPTAPTPTTRRARRSRSATRRLELSRHQHQQRSAHERGGHRRPGRAGHLPQTTLAVDASMTCTAPAGTAEPGQYENLGTATGRAPATGRSPTPIPRTTSARSPDRHREVHQRRDADAAPGPRSRSATRSPGPRDHQHRQRAAAWR